MIIHLAAPANQGPPIQQARTLLLQGGVAACPTESFYALAVDACNEAAIEKVFSLKGRDSGVPVLILIPSVDSLDRYVTRIPACAFSLMRRFWPGGLTLIFAASSEVSPLLTGGTGTVGIRLSGHPVPTALSNAIQGPITGTSANPSGAPPACTAEEVLAYFGERIDLIMDGGETGGGPGSTVLDVTVDPPQIVRPGMITHDQLEGVIGKVRASGY